MARRTFTEDEIAAWTAYRGNGEHTIEETALHFGVSTQTIQKYTPKGIKNEQKKGQKGHIARPADDSKATAEPTARIVRPSVRRMYR